MLNSRTSIKLLWLRFKYAIIKVRWHIKLWQLRNRLKELPPIELKDEDIII